MQSLFWHPRQMAQPTADQAGEDEKEAELGDSNVRDVPEGKRRWNAYILILQPLTGIIRL
jgi:hypothetical protein